MSKKSFNTVNKLIILKSYKNLSKQDLNKEMPKVPGDRQKSILIDF